MRAFSRIRIAVNISGVADVADGGDDIGRNARGLESVVIAGRADRAVEFDIDAGAGVVADDLFDILEVFDRQAGNGAGEAGEVDGEVLTQINGLLENDVVIADDFERGGVGLDGTINQRGVVGIDGQGVGGIDRARTLIAAGNADDGEVVAVSSGVVSIVRIRRTRPAMQRTTTLTILERVESEAGVGDDNLAAVGHHGTIRQGKRALGHVDAIIRDVFVQLLGSEGEGGVVGDGEGQLDVLAECAGVDEVAQSRVGSDQDVDNAGGAKVSVLDAEDSCAELLDLVVGQGERLGVFDLDRRDAAQRGLAQIATILDEDLDVLAGDARTWEGDEANLMDNIPPHCLVTRCRRVIWRSDLMDGDIASKHQSVGACAGVDGQQGAVGGIRAGDIRLACNGDVIITLAGGDADRLGADKILAVAIAALDGNGVTAGGGEDVVANRADEADAGLIFQGQLDAASVGMGVDDRRTIGMEAA